jgi:hypothetical protein
MLIVLASFVAAFVLAAGAVTLTIWRNYHPSFGDVMKVPLPPSASEIQSRRVPGFDGGEYWVSAKVSHQDFLLLMQSLQMTTTPSATVQPEGVLSFQSQTEPLPVWCVSVDGDASTYINDRVDGFIAAKYENGRMFLRRSFS